MAFLPPSHEPGTLLPRAPGGDQPEHAAILTATADAHCEKKEYAEALGCSRKALEITTEAFGKDRGFAFSEAASD